MRVLETGTYLADVARQIAFRGSLVSSVRYAATSAEHRDWHRHPNLHLGYVFRGRGRTEHRAGGEVGAPEGVFVYRAGEEHRWLPEEAGCASVNIEIEPEFLAEQDWTEEEVVAAIARNRDTRLLLLKLAWELQEAPESEEGVRSLLLDLLAPDGEPSPDAVAGWIPRVLEQVHDRWSEGFRLDELSRVVGVHPVTISRGFRRHFSITLSEYQRRLRIEHSLTLLRNTSLSLTDIALRCGFSDQSHFTRTFRQRTGFPPRELRRL